MSDWPNTDRPPDLLAIQAHMRRPLDLLFSHIYKSSTHTRATVMCALLIVLFSHMHELLKRLVLCRAAVDFVAMFTTYHVNVYVQQPLGSL